MSEVRTMTPAEWYEARSQDVADKAKAIKDNRLAIAEALADMRKRADENGDDWSDVLDAYVRPKLNLVIGEREVRRLVAIGRSDNPDQALEEERARTRERVADLRKRQAMDVRTSAPPRDPVMTAIETIKALPPKLRTEAAAMAGYEPKQLPAPKPSIPPAEALAQAIAAVDDETLRAVLSRPEIWNRLRLLIVGGRVTEEFDPETGEIIESRAKAEADAPTVGRVPAEDPSTGIEARGQSASRASEGAGTLASIPPAALGDDPFALPPMCDRTGGV